ncbi:MAG: gliding motility-associated C-terminal domain-containing protein, partial [Bacteroidota bacterium]
CIINEAYFVSNSGWPQASVASNSPASCDSEDGAVTLEPDQFNYSWPDGANTNNRDDLAPGTYQVTITDPGTGCTNLIDFTIGEAECETCADMEIVEVAVTPADCGQSTGALTITMLQPADQYSWTWSPAVGSSNSLSDVASGVYSVTITDLNDANCTIEEVYFISNQDGPVVDVTVGDASCGEADGTATISPDNFSYTWADGGTAAARSDLAAGSYQITVSDPNTGCTNVVEFSIGDDCADCEIEIVDVLVDAANCGQSNGSLRIDLAKAASNYDFNWSPAVSLTNHLTDVPSGVYAVTITDRNDVGCQIEEIYFINNIDGPLATVADRASADCDQANGQVTLSPDSFNYTWPDGSTATTRNDLSAGQYVVEVNDPATGCSNVLELTVGEDCDGCSLEIFSESETTVLTSDCEGTGEFCLGISLEELVSYAVYQNDSPYDNLFGGCSFDSSVSYSYFTVPDMGAAGPYTVDSWYVNGMRYSGSFQTIDDLVDSMNVWDSTTSAWFKDQSQASIRGGNPMTDYSNMTISQTRTAASTVLDLNSRLVPRSASIFLETGMHEIMLVNRETGCSDTIDVRVACIQSEIIRDTILIGSTGQGCINNDELAGEVQSFNNECDEQSGEFVVFDLEVDELCVTYFGMELGTDTACLVLCDEFNICDTTRYIVTVVEESLGTDLPPVANSDKDTATINNDEVIRVLENDIPNGTLDTIYIVNQPDNGRAVVNPDGTITYMPDEDYCDAPNADEFDYAICNSVGCDTATVAVIVQCHELLVYTGISPNGDGVNDVLYIEGIENYPDNRLTIFNRWGNQVYDVKGYRNNWRGTWKGKDLPDGTYFYVLEDGAGNAYNGYIQIHR